MGSCLSSWGYKGDSNPECDILSRKCGCPLRDMFLVSSCSKVRFLNGTVAFCTTNSSAPQGKTIDSPNVLLVRRGRMESAGLSSAQYRPWQKKQPNIWLWGFACSFLTYKIWHMCKWRQASISHWRTADSVCLQSPSPGPVWERQSRMGNAKHKKVQQKHRATVANGP